MQLSRRGLAATVAVTRSRTVTRLQRRLFLDSHSSLGVKAALFSYRQRLISTNTKTTGVDNQVELQSRTLYSLLNPLSLLSWVGRRFRDLRIIAMASINGEVKPQIDLIDTPEAVTKMIEDIMRIPTDQPSIYIDLEGEDLSRTGSLYILQIYSHTENRVYLVDVVKLQALAFDTSDFQGRTLRSILESPAIPKVIFDVRTDSDALYGQFQIHLRGIEDLQLMELATRKYSKRWLNGLAKCIERDAELTEAEKLAFMKQKDVGRKLFKPELGGSYKVFGERPLREEIIEYCAQDVQYLPKLWERYSRKMQPEWGERVKLAVEERIKESHSPTFINDGPNMSKAPEEWIKLV